MTFKDACVDLLLLQKEKGIKKNCVLNCFYIWKKYKQSIPSLEIKVGVFISLHRSILDVVVHTWLEVVRDNEKYIHDVSYDVLMMKEKAQNFTYINFQKYCEMEGSTPYNKRDVLKRILGLEESVKEAKQMFQGELSLQEYLSFTKLNNLLIAKLR